MSDGKVTQAFAATFVEELARCGLRDVCIAPGSRSAPLAMAFARNLIVRVWMHVDERCAGFFALGMAKTAGRPVAVLCTSGTAAAELHPAVIEAHQSFTPLLLLTADRPPELREVGANQAIDQARLYGSAVRWFFDPGPPEERPESDRAWRRLAARALAEAEGPPAGPVHLNLPFREPLTGEPGEAPEVQRAARPPTRLRRGHPQPTPETVDAVAAALEDASRPLVVAGEMRRGERLRLALDALLSRLDAPLLAEPSSQLRRRSAVGLVEAYDALLREPEWAAAHEPDLVLRLGAPPTSKPLNQLLARCAPVTLVLDPEGGWRDPDQLATELVRCDPEPLLHQVAARLQSSTGRWQQEWRDAGAVAAAAMDRRMARTPMHEGHVVSSLAQELPEHASVFVGSSMAIRDVDTFWPPTPPGHRFFGNRGASGIDGLVSTGLGMAGAASGLGPAVLLLGDLSLYHDMNGLWAVRRHGLRVVVVVLDNGGGGIFDFLPPAAHTDVFEELFATPVGLRWEDVARLYDLRFVAATEPAALQAALREAFASPQSTMVCASFDRAASVRGHRACWGAVAEGLLVLERANRLGRPAVP
ncbi:MAG: 2-succinyl-5-enolpyruvyl-6-hydroxy-3-cyclohexene-1-carboxylic-acid synthase [Candidatus Nephthysia bennettiae]|uniref:2-succinyl-5-enolpyruvyl-6-hydroxy-3-cyclohexene-1-carboxylate synthase n=1 Tax=Candidatus Nephthysia bennettiae TaxID=3127016 RepID=A0A934K7G7_9BACT|nr:2-succinyl-5-enolpyruvyl-6-hydroxy-3-cyclohexene-1-carboxylic-acid synthase [Candidatus Dormibacteraeota bacterium]MBJ7612212.1 2-succinyl-5-enolpyruvyl-6-hydroxy-3-cyclohexene-1-carboxylic-acid synthase [Candidatus Dormibacteraeota bacterium]PZR93619.1 MAG: 2-succinyl-5-enolpyruvyl-6-hydroxy-3-cyclohexene-1-carboxylic-acid synthase [Candidatus Dormibacteraeota bacterium]